MFLAGHFKRPRKSRRTNQEGLDYGEGVDSATGVAAVVVFRHKSSYKSS